MRDGRGAGEPAAPGRTDPAGGPSTPGSPFPSHFAGSRRLRSPRLIFVRRAEGEKELATVTCRAACVVHFVMPSSPLPF